MPKKTKIKIYDLKLTTIIVLVVAFFIAVATFPPLLFNPDLMTNQKTNFDNPCSRPQPNQPPIYLRQGRVAQLTNEELLLKIKPLPNEKIEYLNVKLEPETPIIEIRVPSFLNEELKEKSKNGESIIERVTSNLDSIIQDQKINVLSANNTFCQKNIKALRIEYDVIIDTSNPS